MEFDAEALKMVVRKATERGTGARALRSIMERAMRDIMFHLPAKTNLTKCIIKKETILKKKEPTYLYKERRASA